MSAEFQCEGQVVRVKQTSGRWGVIEIHVGGEAPLPISALGERLSQARQLVGQRVRVTGEIQCKRWTAPTGEERVIRNFLCCDLVPLDPGCADYSKRGGSRASDGLDMDDALYRQGLAELEKDGVSAQDVLEGRAR